MKAAALLDADAAAVEGEEAEFELDVDPQLQPHSALRHGALASVLARLQSLQF